MDVANGSSVGFELWLTQPLEPPSGSQPHGTAHVSVTLSVRGGKLAGLYATCGGFDLAPEWFSFLLLFSPPQY